MASQDPTELVLAGFGDVWVGPYGTTLPTTVNTSPGGFNKVGLISEDGVTWSESKDITDFPAWQSRNPVRRSLTGVTFKVTCQLQQWNEDNLVAALGGGQVTSPAAGVYQYSPLGDTEQLDDISVVVDWNDGSEYHRLVSPKANASEGIEVNLKRTELAVIPVTFEALAVSGSDLWNYYTNSTAFSIAS